MRNVEMWVSVNVVHHRSNALLIHFLTHQNRNFGTTKTSKITATHIPKIHAYSIIRPHHPFPSLIRLNIPILCPATSIPLAFFSNPSVVRFNVAVSASRASEKRWEEALRAWARVTREEVRLADSVSLCSRREAGGGWSVVVVEEGGGGLKRLRRVGFDINAEGSEGDRVLVSEDGETCCSAGLFSPSISSSSSGPNKRSSSSPWASMSWSRSVNRLMKARWAKRSDCAACFLEGSLIDEKECSSRSNIVRAYSRF